MLNSQCTASLLFAHQYTKELLSFYEKNIFFFLHSGQIVNDKVIEIYQSFKPSTTEQSDSKDVDIPSTNQSSPENDSNPSTFTSPIKEEQSLSTDEPASELFYDFQAENFHAEQVISLLINLKHLFSFQGAPFVCTTCNGVGHLKSECPELIVPHMIDLPNMSEDWIHILSSLCAQITGKQFDLLQRLQMFDEFRTM